MKKLLLLFHYASRFLVQRNEWRRCTHELWVDDRELLLSGVKKLSLALFAPSLGDDDEVIVKQEQSWSINVPCNVWICEGRREDKEVVSGRRKQKMLSIHTNIPLCAGPEFVCLPDTVYWWRLRCGADGRCLNLSSTGHTTQSERQEMQMMMMMTGRRGRREKREKKKTANDL